LRKIFGPSIKKIGMWRICTNQGLMELYREADIISEIRKGRLVMAKTCGNNARRQNCEGSV